MGSYKKVNVQDVKDLAPDFGMGEMGEARFGRQSVGAEAIGFAYYRMNPGRRLGFGHRHGESEEMYMILGGSGRFKVEDDVFDVTPKDVVYCRPGAMREWESGPDGLELLAFGSHVENDAEMQREWWTD